MKQGTANLAEDYCFIHKALRPVGTARRQIAAVPPSNSRPAVSELFVCDLYVCKFLHFKSIHEHEKYIGICFCLLIVIMLRGF